MMQELLATYGFEFRFDLNKPAPYSIPSNKNRANMPTTVFKFLITPAVITLRVKVTATRKCAWMNCTARISVPVAKRLRAELRPGDYLRLTITPKRNSTENI